MNIYRILKHGTSGQIKRILMILAMIYVVVLAITGVLYIKDVLVEKNWYKTEAIVVDYDTTNSKDVWTELEYQYGEKDYNIKIKGHSFYMVNGSRVEIYVNQRNPEKIKMANQLYGIAKALLKVDMVMIIITLLFVVPVYIEKKRK